MTGSGKDKLQHGGLFVQFAGQRTGRALIDGPLYGLCFGGIDIDPGSPHRFKNLGQMREAVARMDAFFRVPENRDVIVAVDPFHE
jgi:hypothetical protein